MIACRSAKTGRRWSWSATGSNCSAKRCTSRPGATDRIEGHARRNRASETFTRGFTQKFPDSPRNRPSMPSCAILIDMLVACRVHPQPTTPSKPAGRWKLLAAKSPAGRKRKPRHSKWPARLNAAWRGGRFTAVAGGGVSIQADRPSTPKLLLPDKDGQLSRARENLPPSRRPIVGGGTESDGGRALMPPCESAESQISARLRR